MSDVKEKLKKIIAGFPSLSSSKGVEECLIRLGVKIKDGDDWIDGYLYVGIDGQIYAKPGKIDVVRLSDYTLCSERNSRNVCLTYLPKNTDYYVVYKVVVAIGAEKVPGVAYCTPGEGAQLFVRSLEQFQDDKWACRQILS